MSEELVFGAETENKHFDVGVVGWWYNDNYGGTLTYYALNRLIQSMGYSVLMIERPTGDPNYKPNYSTIPRRFAKKYYNISKNYHPNKLGILNNMCNAFVSGSDQLFSPYLWEYSGPPYYLDFTAPDKNTISYASSFGNSYSASEKFKMTISYYLRRFNALSVREDYGVDIMRDVFGLNVKKVLDPVFVCDPKEYDKLIARSSADTSGKYFTSFILDPDEGKRNAIQNAKKQLGLNYVNLIHAMDFEENIKKLGLDNVKPNADIEDFLKYYKNAEFIITDSFHGTCFAIIFRKPFISIANKQRGTGRFVSLLNELGLQDRLVNDSSEIFNRPELFEKIDYTETENRLRTLREDSYNWLKSVLNTPVSKAKNDFQIMENRQNILANRVNKLSEQLNELKKSSLLSPINTSSAGSNVQTAQGVVEQKNNNRNSVTDLLDMSRCTGCGVCAEVCPTDAIKIQQNVRGFLNPTIDDKQCINCGKCASKCIALNPKYNKSIEPKCYAVMADNDVRKKSSSGGMFTLAADYILGIGGYVCGAALDENFNLNHIIIDNINELDKLRGSKYIQSNAGQVYPKIKELLEKDNYVLFTGMPCQVAGLYSYLGKEYKKLYTMDLLCHGITSQKVFDKYRAEVLEKDGKHLTDIKFKAKEPWGWHAGINADFSDGSHYAEPLERDPYYIAYLNSISKNTSCGTCTVNRLPRQGDLTIGDFWGINNYDASLNDGKGTSVVLVNSSSGDELLKKSGEKAILLKEMPLKAAIAGNHCIEHPYALSKNNAAFFDNFDELPFDALALGCRDNRIYEQQYIELIKKVAKEDMEYYLLAKAAVKNAHGRQIVTWIRSGRFEKLLKEHFGVTVKFGVSQSENKLKPGYIENFDKLKGQSDKYYIVSFDRAYDEAIYKTLNDYGYTEIKDFLFRKHKPIVLENYDCSKGRYSDAYGNTIDGWDAVIGKIVFRGGNNHLIFGKGIHKVPNLDISVLSNTTIQIGDQVEFNDKVHIMSSFEYNGSSKVIIKNNVRFTDAVIRVVNHPHESSLLINDSCTFERNLHLHVNSGKKIIIGRDCMFSHDINVMSGDGHTIFDVSSGRNINSDYENQPAYRNSIVVGEHTWIGWGAFLLSGTNVGNGSVVGAKSIVKGQYPNNCSIAGNPAKVVRKNIAWSRDMIAIDMKKQCGSEEYVRLTGHAKPPISGLKVLVIGGTRFMGVCLVRELLSLGNNVTIATRGNKKDNFGMHVERIKMDVTDAESVKSALDGKHFDVVFDNLAYTAKNVKNVLSSVSCKKYVQLSSIAVYADRNLNLSLNLKPNQFDPYRVNLPKAELADTDNPNYANGKRQAEAMVYQQFKNIPAVTVRIPYVTKTERIYWYCLHVVNEQPMDIPDTSKGFTFIRDTEVGKFLPWIAAQDFTGPINLASEGMVTIKTMLEYIEKKTGKKAIIDTSNGEKGHFNIFNEKSFTLDMSKTKQLGYTSSNINDWFWRLMDEYIERAMRDKR